MKELKEKIKGVLVKEKENGYNTTAKIIMGTIACVSLGVIINKSKSRCKPKVDNTEYRYLIDDLCGIKNALDSCFEKDDMLVISQITSGNYQGTVTIKKYGDED